MSHPHASTAGVPLLTYALHHASCVANMSDKSIASIPCIAIDGADARRFAQMQFSGDVQTLASGQWQWNAWLDAQGRVRALMQLADTGDGRLLAMLRGGDAERVREGLARYLLRAQAHLSACVCTGYTDTALAVGLIETIGQDVVLGYGERSLRLRPEQAGAAPALPDPDASNSWRLEDIRAGWPTLPDSEARFLPPALGLERLGAVAFDKGCYPGQEIAARLHYRGGHKLRLHHLRGTTPLPPGTTSESAGIGPIHVLDSARSDFGTELLAVTVQTDTHTISILNNKYDVVSTFDA